MIRIALRTLRFHKGGFLASFIALFFGAAIVIGSGGLLETGLHNAAPPKRLAGAPIVVTGDQLYPGSQSGELFAERIRLDAKLAGTIAAVPGVGETVPDVSFQAALTDGSGKQAGQKVTGHGWASARLTPYKLTEGSPPAGARQAVVGAGLAEQAGLSVGDKLPLLVHGAAESYEISGLSTGPDGASSVFLADAEAARVTGRPGAVDSFGVFPAAGADLGAVRESLAKAVVGKQATVTTGDDRGRAENPDVIADGGDLVSLAAAFGGLSAMVTVFVVSSTLGLSIQQRQREMALLRAIGTTPGQLRRLILGETVFVAAIATALACWPGPSVGSWLLSAFADAGVVPEAIEYRAGWVPLAVGAGTAMLTAVGAAFIAARRAARTRPTEALSEAALQHRWFSGVRLVFALLCLGGGTALAMVTANMDGPEAGSTATPAAMLWTAGVGLLGPGLAKGIAAALHGPVRAVSGLAGRLAMLNTKVRTPQLAGAVMPVMLATGLAIALIYLQTTQASGSERAFDESLRADLVVTSDSGGLPLDAVDTIRAQPGVAAASAQIPSLGYIEPKGAPAVPPPVDENADGEEVERPEPVAVSMQGITPEGLTRTTAFRASQGSLDALRGNTVALPTRYTDGRKIGDKVPMRLGDGSRVVLELVATVEGKRGYETALLPASVLVAHTDTGLVPQIMVSAEPGTDQAKLAGTLSALAASQPGLRVADREALTLVRADQDDTQSWMAYLLLGVVVGYATIALVNTQVLSTTERRREFMLQRLIGSTRRQVMQMMTVEAVLVAVAGIVLGVLVALLTLVPLSMSVLGSAVPDGSPWIFVTVVVAALGLTLGTTLLASAAVLRSRPGDVVGARE
ncbi:FtsX-like permease family protein [Streptomyces sp. NPDC091272]|uniref:FtsX-like permease family protein n=1 Tax=Streptomyces sp. NPDC091272 TaxID=3365981 RepID=UPI00380154CA